jgi:hypothetical protein
MIALASSSVIAAVPELVPQSKQSAAPIDVSLPNHPVLGSQQGLPE